MHDVKKTRLAELTEKEKRINDEKIAKFKALYDDMFGRRDNKDYTRSTMAELSKLNEINPENTSMWNFRRKILNHLWEEAKTDALAKAKVNAKETEAKSKENWEQEKHEEGAEMPNFKVSPAEVMKQVHDELKPIIGKDIKAELELNTTIIKKDYKCYAAFVHRQWIITRIEPLSKRAEILHLENAQCEKLLKLDERNFHTWGYRRWITGQLQELRDPETGVALYSDEKEMKFSATKIGANFSNYSAWHNRALCFQREFDAGEFGSLSQKLCEEMELLVRAFYCDPKDQSAWLYAEWVMETLKKSNPEIHKKKSEELLSNCGELIEAEEEELAEAGASAVNTLATPGFAGQVLALKWPIWFSLVLHRQLGGASDPVAARKLLDRLCEVDPARQACFRATLTGLQ